MDRIHHLAQSTYSNADFAAAIGRSVIDGLLANELTPAQAFHKARLAGSFARLALEEKDRAQLLAENIRREFLVVTRQHAGVE